MATVLQSLRPVRCIADSNNSGQRLAVSDYWHLHTGTVQLFIVGPGMDAWLAVSEPCYSGPIGTDEERAIANRAVRILDRLRRYDYAAGPREIKAALRQAAREIRKGTPEIIAPPPPEEEPRKAQVPPGVKDNARPADMRIVHRVLAAVSKVTGKPEALVYSNKNPGCDIRLGTARCLFQGILKELHPHTYIYALAEATGRCSSAFSHAVINHKSRLLFNKSYAATYQKAIALCNPTSALSTECPCSTSEESPRGMAATCWPMAGTAPSAPSKSSLL